MSNNSSTINILLTFCNSYAIVIHMETIKQKPNTLLKISSLATVALLGSGLIIGGSSEGKESCTEVTAGKETASELVDRIAKALPGESTPDDVNYATGGDYSKTVSEGQKYKVCSTEDGHLSLNKLD